MSDERGGRYFGPARFFLGGDRVVAQSHINDVRKLFGYMRDQASLGGPQYQVQYMQLPDGTVAKAVRNGDLYQAEIISQRKGGEKKQKYPATVVGHKFVSGGGSYLDYKSLPIKWQRTTGVVELTIPPGYTYGTALDVSDDGRVVYGRVWNTPVSSSDWPHLIVVWQGATSVTSIGLVDGTDVVGIPTGLFYNRVDFGNANSTRHAPIESNTYVFSRYATAAQLYTPVSAANTGVITVPTAGSSVTVSTGLAEVHTLSRNGLVAIGRGASSASIASRSDIYGVFSTPVDMSGMLAAYGFSAANDLVVGGVHRTISPYPGNYTLPMLWSTTTGSVLIEPIDLGPIGYDPESFFPGNMLLSREMVSALDCLTGDDTDELVYVGSMVGNHDTDEYDTERPVAWSIEWSGSAWVPTRIDALFNAFPGRLLATN